MMGVRGQRLRESGHAGLRALEETSEAERLRLALLGAGEAAFDWTMADDRVAWSGVELLLSHQPDAEQWKSGEGFCEWLSPRARAKLLAFIDERSPAEPAFTLEFEIIYAERREWFELRATRIPDISGRAERIAGVLRPITEQKTTLDR